MNFFSFLQLTLFNLIMQNALDFLYLAHFDVASSLKLFEKKSKDTLKIVLWLVVKIVYIKKLVVDLEEFQAKWKNIWSIQNKFIWI